MTSGYTHHYGDSHDWRARVSHNYINNTVDITLARPTPDGRIQYATGITSGELDLTHPEHPHSDPATLLRYLPDHAAIALRDALNHAYPTPQNPTPPTNPNDALIPTAALDYLNRELTEARRRVDQLADALTTLITRGQ